MALSIMAFWKDCFQDHGTNRTMLRGRILLRIAQAIAHLETHYAESLKLEDLICIADMSRRSFLRAFETATGFTPIAYQIQLRINRAADLLVRTTESITNIAYEVGFSDSNYFARQFRQHHGMSPRTYRRQSN